MKSLRKDRFFSRRRALGKSETDGTFTVYWGECARTGGKINLGYVPSVPIFSELGGKINLGYVPSVPIFSPSPYFPVRMIKAN